MIYPLLLIRQDGILVLSKGPKAEEEVRELREIKYKVLPFTLPLTDIQRQIIVVNLKRINSTDEL
jgi:hypothetical protein